MPFPMPFANSGIGIGHLFFTANAERDKMNDLFGVEIEDVRSFFSEQEVDDFLDNVIFEGELIKQVGSNLQELKSQKTTDKFNPVRKVAWEDFLWIYDLGMPATVSFDTACDATNSDAEHIRCMISREFADEIRTMYETIITRLPECSEEISRKLRRYVTLN